MIDVEAAADFVEIGMANIAREYPNHPGHLLSGPEDLRPPSELHPIFSGSYDWHSSVHQHWMLVRLLRAVPALPAAPAVRRVLDTRFTKAAGEAEAAYFDGSARRSFERPYGWAWLLALHAEVASWDDAAARRWADCLAPLADRLRERSQRWLADAVYPQRVGTHANSAFAAGLIIDAAKATGHTRLRETAAAAAQRWYADDAGYPAWIEPSATDFFSPALVEADVMTRLLGPEAFSEWFERFLPDARLLEVPVEPQDRTDPQFVHLDGLNLSRAWCWQRIADHLPPGHPRRAPATTAAERHAAAGLSHVRSGAYVGEHWLPTFAVYLLTR